MRQARDLKTILNAEASSKLKTQEEGRDRFRIASMADTWYVEFLQMLTENVPKADVENIFENIGIITFNYDRCIERFLSQSLCDYYDLPEQESQRILSKLQIIHPYGVVGLLPWQSRAEGVPFGSSQADLSQAVNRIRTFSEGLDNEEMLTRMRILIKEAETLVFLGFAFHPMNMELLSPQCRANTKRIFATTFGMSDADEKVIQDDIRRMLGLDKTERVKQKLIQAETSKVTCREFFQQYFRSLSAAV